MNIATPLPNAQESEAMVLAAAIDDPRSYYEICGIVTERDFTTPEFATVWKQIGELAAANKRPTLHKLRETYGGSAVDYVRTALTGVSPIPGLAKESAHHMVDRSSLRKIALVVSDLQGRVTTAKTADDARRAIESAFSDACGITTQSKGFRKAREIVSDIEARIADPSRAPRFPTGFPSLDRMLNGGLKEKTLVIIGGRTGGGKTILAMNLIVHIALKGVPVAVFSLEMEDLDLLTRCIFSEGVMRTQEEAIEAVRNLPLWVDDTSTVTLRSIAARIKLMILKHNIKVFVVDYLQLITTDGLDRESRERVVANMSRVLKNTAKETNCTIIALSQLNEAGELRESRAIEQDADLVLYVMDNEDDEMFLRVTKQRGGEKHGIISRAKEDVPGIPLRWFKPSFRFVEK